MTNPFARAAAPAAAAAPEQAPTSGAFHAPNKGSGTAITKDDWRSFIGHLVLFEVQDFREKVPTSNGEADAVLADVHVIDHPDEPKVFERALVFPPALVTATREIRDEDGHLISKAGDKPYMVLGRIAEYTTKANRKTVELADHADDDVKIATDYLEWRKKNQIAQPAQSAAPNADPWATSAAAAEEPPF